MITAWRLFDSSKSDGPLSGRGSALYPGRWNQSGVPVAYLSESRSLASLEVLVNAEDPVLLSAIPYVIIPVSFDDTLVQTLKTLPPDWARWPVPLSTRQAGDQWVASARSLVLKVPSAVTRGECNYVINTVHPDFRKLIIGAPLKFRFDPRLLGGSKT